jgi:hypothetical protein
LHPGGSIVTLTDGSVRFLSETTNAANVIHWMSLRNDGNVFDLP